MTPPLSTALAAHGAGFPADGRAEFARSSDLELVRRARAERAAFTELYRRHYPAVGSYLWRRTGDAHATEDLLAETFLAALQGLDRLREREVEPRFWLLRIATNLLHKRWRDGAVRATATELEPDVHVSHADATNALVIEEDQARAQRALRALAPDQQSVLALHYVEGLALGDIALVLDCKVGTVKSRLSRARQALAIELARRR